MGLAWVGESVCGYVCVRSVCVNLVACGCAVQTSLRVFFFAGAKRDVRLWVCGASLR